MITDEPRLKMELDNLENESFDHLNFQEKITQYSSILTSIDTSIRVRMQAAKDAEKLAKESIDDPTVKAQVWTKDPWYAGTQCYITANHALKDVIGYKDWFVLFSSKIQEKIISVLNSIKGAGEEKIIVATQQKMFESFMEKFETMSNSREERLMKMLETEREHERDMETTRKKGEDDRMLHLMEISGFKDGVAMKKKEGELEEAKKRIEGLEKLLKEKKEVKVEEKEEPTEEEIPEDVKKLTPTRRKVYDAVKKGITKKGELIRETKLGAPQVGQAFKHLQQIGLLDEKIVLGD